MKNKLPLCDLVQAAKSFTQVVINEALEPIRLALENLLSRVDDFSEVEIQIEIESILKTIDKMRNGQ